LEPAVRFLFLLLWLPLTACAERPYVVLADTTFQVEVMDDDGERAMGLMFRDHLDDTHGMLFIFPGEEPQSFWMKNTRIPLDILYFDAELKLVSMQQDVQPCKVRQCPGYPSEGPAQYVLELNAGTAKRLGVAKGDLLTLAL
jgi:uncharacterized membrane protein (UPF0127 family)